MGYDNNYEKIVDFHKYCNICRHVNESENAEPCCECLENPTNFETERPVKFEKK